MDVLRHLICIHLLIAILEGVSGIQMFVTPSSIVLNSGVPGPVTMACGLTESEKDMAIKQIFDISILRNSKWESHNYQAVIATMSAGGQPELYSIADITRRNPEISGQLQTMDPDHLDPAERRNEATLELKWNSSHIECKDVGEYHCQMAVKEIDNQVKTWLTPQPAELQTTTYPENLEIKLNGFPVGNGEATITKPAVYNMGNIVPMSCSASIGSTRNQKIDWYQTKSSTSDVNEIMKFTPTEFDKLDEGSVSDTPTNCQYQRTTTLDYNVTLMDQRRVSVFLFMCKLEYFNSRSQRKILESRRIFIKADKAEIGSFTIFGRPGGGSHTFDELSTFTFHCVVDIYPSSHVTINKDGQSLESRNGVSELSLAINKATCSDAGLYSCVGYNEFNGVDMPVGDIQVFVRCKPRPLDLENNATFYKALHEDVVLSLKVIAYPNPSEFRWSKQNNDSTWTGLTSGVAISALESSLAIGDLQEADYGQYRTIVVNSIGTLVHYFFITKPVKGSAAAQHPGVYIGAGVGAFAAVVAIIVITVIVIRKRRKSPNGRARRSQQSEKESSPPNRNRNEGQVQECINMDDSQESRGSTEKHVYEELKSQTKGTGVYDVLGSESDLTDVGTPVGREEQYENLSM